MGMLTTEWKLDEALAVQYKEGREERETEIAKNALAEGLPVEVIRKITGLDQATLTQLAAQ
jgi:predicted transposase YdaD